MPDRPGSSVLQISGTCSTGWRHSFQGSISLFGRNTSHNRVPPHQEVAPGRPPDLRAVQAGHVSRASQLFSEVLAAQIEQSENCDGSNRKPQGCGQQYIVVRLQVCLEGHEAPSPNLRPLPALSSLNARVAPRRSLFRSQDCLVTTDSGGLFLGGPPSFMATRPVLSSLMLRSRHVANQSTGQFSVKPGEPESKTGQCPC